MRALMSEESFGGDIKCEKWDGGSGDHTVEWFDGFKLLSGNNTNVTWHYLIFKSFSLK